MKAIMVMFDTLTRGFTPNYGNGWVEAPNFKRLQEKCMTFDNFYAGSMVEQQSLYDLGRISGQEGDRWRPRLAFDKNNLK